MQTNKKSVVEAKRREAQDEKAALLQKIRENLMLENQAKEERLREKRQDVQN